MKDKLRKEYYIGAKLILKNEINAKQNPHTSRYSYNLQLECL